MQRQIAQFLRYLQVERGASPHTLKAYREDLTAIADYYADEQGVTPDPGTLTAVDLRGLLAALHEAGFAKTSIARKLASLRSFFRFGQREGWVQSNPARALRNPRKGRSLPHFLSTDDVGKLLAAPPAHGLAGLRDRAILETLYSAGLRVSELVGLNDGDMDLPQGVVRVRGKGRKERLAPLGSF
ncbi:MAG TPA: site-specific integrase, partial [Lacipirellulaceae bacterium]|nr:site-specific integrase [Lacipirellulaceae bacterium]